jgi:hypothetical protein
MTSKGAVFARIEDAAAALLKITSDTQLTGNYSEGSSMYVL